MYGEPSRYDNYIFYMKCYLMMVFGGAELYTAEQRAVRLFLLFFLIFFFSFVFSLKGFGGCIRPKNIHLLRKT